MSGISDGSFNCGSLITTAAVGTPAWDLGFPIPRQIVSPSRTITDCLTRIESSRRRFWAGSITSTVSNPTRHED
jgi:hypothetical protein